MPGNLKRTVAGPPPRVWGQPKAEATILASKTVHPHVCGDNAGRFPAGDTHHGPPPRVWGQLSVTSVVLPARGPPPRVWGQRCFKTPERRRIRSTPTCVGTTRANRLIRSAVAVHPHVCGDNIPKTNADCSGKRSTPTCVGTTPDIVAHPIVHHNIDSRYIFRCALRHNLLYSEAKQNAISCFCLAAQKAAGSLRQASG